MLIEKVNLDRTKTTYECDRCGDVMYAQKNYRLYIQKFKDRSPKKRWDLCPRCYAMLVKGIEKR